MENKNYPKLDESLLGAFVGADKRDYYLKKWKKSGQTWNWAAFFLSIFWLGYRKMYMYLFIILGLYLLFDLFVVFSGVNVGEDNTITITVAVICGFLGNYLYLQHANKEIQKVTEQQLGREEDVQAELQRRGGTSGLGVLIAFGGLVVYMVLGTLLYGG